MTNFLEKEHSWLKHYIKYWITTVFPDQVLEAMKVTNQHESERLFGVSKNIHLRDKFFKLDDLIFLEGRQKQIGKFQSSHMQTEYGLFGIMSKLGKGMLTSSFQIIIFLF